MDQVNPGIFKAYDIRGIYPSQLNEEIAYRIGRAYAKLMQEELKKDALEIVVSNDMRLSSPQLKGKLIQGLLDSGVIVYDAGFLSTATFYFAVGYYQKDGGIQVSASHNPSEYNGFKLVRAKAVPVSEDSGIMQIRDWVIENNFHKANQNGIFRPLSKVTPTMASSFLDGEDLESINPLKVVIDAANSVNILDIQAIFKQIPQIELVVINGEINGNFPAHEADPLKDENLNQLQEAVINHKADIGLAPDGDGDRYFVITEKGELVRQEILRGIMAQISLGDHPGATICYDIRPGKITLDMILEAGGTPSVTRVGHSLIKEQMLKLNAVFGGESSGHYFYQTKWGTFEAPALLITKLLRYISQQNKPLSKIIAPLKKYFHSGEINSTVNDVTAKLQAIREKYANAKELSDLDGITVTYDDFWFNVRPSNTEPKLRLNLEAINHEIMTSKRDEVLNLIRS